MRTHCHAPALQIFAPGLPKIDHDFRTDAMTDQPAAPGWGAAVQSRMIQSLEMKRDG